ncbi:MAG: hypothetical protein JXB88_00135 [Spirochaetales bacterium]|nr:hypothetical protein [Spirochaetales bacterium]
MVVPERIIYRIERGTQTGCSTIIKIESFTIKIESFSLSGREFDIGQALLTKKKK